MPDGAFTITPENCKEVRRGLARTPNGQWSHVSRRGERVILRRLSNTTERMELKLEDLGNILTGHTFVPCEILRFYTDEDQRSPGNVSHKETNFWKGLAEGFDKEPDLWKPPIVPTTQLRDHYFAVRESAKDRLASATLADMFANSLRQLEEYSNIREGWPDEENRKLSDDRTFARSVARNLADGVIVAPWEYVFVAREFSPLRTTEAGAPSSGDGGIDALLASDNEDDRALPIIVEVKSKTDTSTYLGLLQSLTYTSELITPNQRKRLARYYPKQFGNLTAEPGPFADIWIVVEDGKVDSEQEATMQIAQEFLKDAKVSSLLRRIIFLKLGPESRKLEFSGKGPQG